MAKLLLTGGHGLLGRPIAEIFQHAGWEVCAPTHAAVDLSRGEAVAALLAQCHPDLIINCAAQRRPDLCESASPEVMALNVDLPCRLADARRPLIHISTDYVFNGANAPYAPTDHRCPINAYGRQKAAAEEGLEGREGVLIVRLPILFGPTADLRNSAVTILAANLLAARGHAVKMDDLAIRYPTFTCDIARQLLTLAHPLQEGRLQGIVHYSAEEPMTKFLMALTMAPLIGCDPTLCLPDRTPPAVPRPYDCHLSTKTLRQTGLFVEPTPFATAIARVLMCRG